LLNTIGELKEKPRTKEYIAENIPNGAAGYYLLGLVNERKG
jgi:hypothetical protein